MSDCEISKIITNYNPEGKRGASRHKVRWTNVVNNDMRKVGVRNWRIEAPHRK
jgi:hypothetical protein